MSKLERNAWVMITKKARSTEVTTRIFMSDSPKDAQAWLAESRAQKLGNTYVTLCDMERIYDWLVNDNVSKLFANNLRYIEEAKLPMGAQTLYLDAKRKFEEYLSNNSIAMAEDMFNGIEVVKINYPAVEAPKEEKPKAEKTKKPAKKAEPKADANSESETPITVTCGGQVETWVSRQAAIDFYTQGVLETEGSEQGRYAKILADLTEGLTECTDVE